jgi:hypothetical protein
MSYVMAENLVQCNWLFTAAKMLNLFLLPEYSLPLYHNTVRSESRCALRLRYVDLVVSIEVAVEVCCCFTVFSC